MSARGRMGAIVLILAAVFTLCVGEARAQTADVCRGGAPTAGERIVCTEPAGSTADITIYVQDLTIATTGDNSRGIFSRHYGTGAIDIDVREATIIITEVDGIGIYGIQEFNDNSLKIYAKNVVIMTKYVGIWGNHTGDGGNVYIDVRGGTITTEGADAHGVYGARQLGSGDVAINAENLTITTKGLYS